MERTKNATKNMLFGWILHCYNMILPFIVRTVMIYTLGIQYLGLNSLFVSIITVLNLAELGVGNAMVFSMYKPIAENDEDKICKLMNLYKLYYRIIGIVICVLGIIVSPFLKYIIKSDVPQDINIYILYFLNLALTVSSYWLFSYKSSLLYAFQKRYIESKIIMVVNTIKTVLQLLSLYFTKNYYIYIIIAIVFQIISNITIAIFTNRYFPQYKARGMLEKTEIKDINRKVKDLFTAQISTTFIGQVDTIIISAFLGLRYLAIYQNYFYILSSVRTLITVAFHSCIAGIGNSIIVESEEKNIGDLKKLTFIVCWISGVCMSCFLGLYQPFMKIWVGEELMLGYGAVISFSLYFYVLEINQLLSVYKEAGGLWSKDKYRPLATAVLNIILNLLLVKHLGIYGIIFATFISMLVVSIPWLFQNLFTELFSKKWLKYYLKKLFGYTIISLISATITTIICININLGDFQTLFVRMIICVLVPNIIYIIVYFKKTEMEELINLIDVMTNRRFNLINILKRFRKE